MARTSALLPSDPGHDQSLLHRSKMAGVNHCLGDADALRQSVKTVTIPEVKYDYLVQTTYQFAKLKGSLLNGGLSQEILDVLIGGVQAPPKPPYQDHEQPASQPAKSNVHANRLTSNTDSGYKTGGDSEDYDGEDEDGADSVFVSPTEEKDDFEDSSKSGRSSIAFSRRRTVMISNLPDRTSDDHIVDAVRGGALLHIYFRPHDHFANVSFVDESAAQHFLRHTKMHGFRVAGKRVETMWSDRQFYLPPYVRAKINGGASRILVIHNAHPCITEQLVRKDLEHIHNLIVISVRFKGGNVYISTNSVHNALFARSCMISRRTYKGMRIWFCPDECAGPLAGPINLPKKTMNPSPTKPASRPNRFQILSLGGSEGDEEEDDDYDSIPGGLISHSSLSGGTWDDRF